MIILVALLFLAAFLAVFFAGRSAWLKADRDHWQRVAAAERDGREKIYALGYEMAAKADDLANEKNRIVDALWQRLTEDEKREINQVRELEAMLRKEG